MCGGKDYTRKIAELKEDSESFKVALENVQRLIKTQASSVEIERAQCFLYNIEKEICEESKHQYTYSILLVLFSYTAKLLSIFSSFVIPGLAAYCIYRLSSVPIKIITETSAIGGNIVGSTLGGVAFVVQELANVGLLFFDYSMTLMGYTSDTNTIPFTFAQGIGSNYGQIATEAATNVIKDLGGQDTQIVCSIIVFISVFLLLQSFNFLAGKAENFVKIIEKKDISFSITPISIRLDLLSPRCNIKRDNGLNGAFHRLFDDQISKNPLYFTNNSQARTTQVSIEEFPLRP